MSAPPDLSDAEQEVEPPRPRSTTLWRTAGVVTMLLIALFWIWAFSQSLRQSDTPASSRNPDYLDDRGWVEAAQARCEPVMAGIDERSQGAVRQDVDERADDIDASTAELRDMLDALSEPPPATEEDREVFDLWMADWRTHLDDRDRYVQAIRTDPTARFITTERFSDQLETVIELFADVNGMPACATAGDVG